MDVDTGRYHYIQVSQNVGSYARRSVIATLDAQMRPTAAIVSILREEHINQLHLSSYIFALLRFRLYAICFEWLIDDRLGQSLTNDHRLIRLIWLPITHEKHFWGTLLHCDHHHRSRILVSKRAICSGSAENERVVSKSTDRTER